MKPFPTRRTAALLVAAGLTVLVAGCGDDDEVNAGTPSGGGSGTASVLFEVTRFGGFVPFGFDFSSPPLVVVYEDGRTVTPGPVPAIFPGPASTPLVEGQIPPERREALLALAEEAGLLGEQPPDYGEAAVADVPVTRVRIVTGGTEHVVEVIGPEFDDDPQLSEEQSHNRRLLADFIAALTSEATAGEIGPYPPSGYRVVPFEPSPSEPGIEPNELAWPIDQALVENECQTVEGDDARAFADLLAEATQITLWESGGARWQLAIRPLLEHESGCPED